MYKYASQACVCVHVFMCVCVCVLMGLTLGKDKCVSMATGDHGPPPPPPKTQEQEFWLGLGLVWSQLWINKETDFQTGAPRIPCGPWADVRGPGTWSHCKRHNWSVCFRA
ncbi:unnamed protein product [Lota lota]